MKNLCVLILAAGKGTRMVSSRAKVLHEICGRPMLRFTYCAAAGLEADNIYVIIGNDSDRVQQTLSGYPVRFIIQESQLGTGHAALCAREELSRCTGDVLVLMGDIPRIRTETLAKLVTHHRETGAATTLLTACLPDPFGYGRILRGPDGGVIGIVEEKDATPEQRKIQEINAALYCFKIPELLRALGKLSTENIQKEYYLTDVIGIQYREGRKIAAMLHGDFEELRGINNRQELALMSRLLWNAKNIALASAGVTVMAPDQTFVDPDVVVGKDCTLYPQVKLEGKTIVGENTVVRSGSRITNSTIGNNVEILDSCVITDAEIGDGCRVGPCAHLREHSRIGLDCRIGNFVEIKKSTLGDRSLACHLAYLGDAIVGKDVIVGAGVITCNFDGQKKNITIIEDGAFIGTDSQLIAPVRIGKGSFVAAGSCITSDVPAGALGIARKRQLNKAGWVSRRGRNNAGTPRRKRKPSRRTPRLTSPRHEGQK